MVRRCYICDNLLARVTSRREDTPMTDLIPILDLAALRATLADAFPGSDPATFPRVAELAPGRVLVVAPYRGGGLRPGGVLAGPNLMALADHAAYALVLAHVGPKLMAVTSQLNMSFLRGALPGDLHAEATMLRLGRRLAVCDVRLWTESRERLAAQANVTYAIPQ